MICTGYRGLDLGPWGLLVVSGMVREAFMWPTGFCWAWCPGVFLSPLQWAESVFGMGQFMSLFIVSLFTTTSTTPMVKVG